MRTLLLCAALTAQATTVTFDDLPTSGVTFNMSYGTLALEAGQLKATPDGSYDYSFLTVIFDEPPTAASISFDLAGVRPDHIFVVQSYSAVGTVLDELIIFGGQQVQLTNGSPYFFVVIDAGAYPAEGPTGPLGFTVDNLTFGATEVPEPGMAGMAGLLLCAVAAKRLYRELRPWMKRR